MNDDGYGARPFTEGPGRNVDWESMIADMFTLRI